ncbi:hypothetical protein B0H13DRAFT_2473236 [Mycena leptocephala]|nr:hypothetical protein B0H13DRAFT_2473236 [Mycena leptocephala]
MCPPSLSRTIGSFLQFDRISLPWDQITYLELDKSVFVVVPGHFLSLFHLCPNLVRCELVNTSGYFAMQPPTNPYNHPKLQHFSVSGHTANIYNAFTFPSMSSMAILDCKLVSQELLEFLTRSAVLKTLSMEPAPGCTVSSVFVLLTAVPLLTNLTVDCSSSLSVTFWTEFFDLFGKFWICPNLARLTLMDSIPERGFSYEALSAMLYNRRLNYKTLGTLSACSVVFRCSRQPRRPHPSVVVQLDCLLQAKMAISISSPAIRWPRRRIQAFTDLFP